MALATLMPIVAGIGGNSGNQTMTMIIRVARAGPDHPGQCAPVDRQGNGDQLAQWRDLGRRGGVFAFLLYHSVALGLVMMSAMLLNLLVGALVGMVVPLIMQKMGRDPAIGSSVLLTFTTDSMGFFIFLGLATVFLM